MVPDDRLEPGGQEPIHKRVQGAVLAGVRVRVGQVPDHKPELGDGAPEASSMPLSWAGAGSTRTMAGQVRVRKCTGEPWRDDGAVSAGAVGGTWAALESRRRMVALRVRDGMRAALAPFRTEDGGVCAAPELPHTLIPGRVGAGDEGGTRGGTVAGTQLWTRTGPVVGAVGTRRTGAGGSEGRARARGSGRVGAAAGSPAGRKRG